MRLLPLIQRAFDSTIANWPLLLIRVAGSVAMTIVIVAAVVPVVLFAIYSGTMTDIESVSSSDEVIQWLWANAIVIMALILVITLIVAVAIAIHAFISGGVAGIYLDADRTAPRESWVRQQLALFSPDRWLAHARRTWWPIFIIYNLTWGIWCLILLLPLAVVVPLFIAAAGNEALGVAGCLILAIWIFAAFFGSVFVHIWTELAVIDCVRGAEARVLASLRGGVSLLLSNFIRVIALVFLMFIVTLAIGSASFAMQFGFELGMQADELALIFIPIQIVFSLVQTAISVVMSAWLMAGFATIVNESRGTSGAPLPSPPATAGV